MTSGRSRRRRCCSGVRRFCTYLSSRMSCSDLPRSCSRTTYLTTCSSADPHREEKREHVLERRHEKRLYPGAMRRTSREGRYAERSLTGVDDVGVEERIVIWIERRPGAVWAGPSGEPQLRDSTSLGRKTSSSRATNSRTRSTERTRPSRTTSACSRTTGCRRRKAVHAQRGAAVARALVLQPLATGPVLASAPRADPRRPQSGPRRRIHVLGADEGPRRHAGSRVRAGPRRHPDAEPVGEGGAPRGDGSLARGLSVRAGGLRAPARGASVQATGRSSSRGRR